MTTTDHRAPPQTDDGRITVEFTTQDRTLTELLTIIRDLSPWDPARHECEAQLYLSLARMAHREADRLRHTQRRTA